MRVLMLSGDKNVLVPNTDAYRRYVLQRSVVDRLDVLVWPQVHATREIRAAIIKNNYDVLTVQDPFWRGLLGWRLARRFGLKYNVQLHADLAKQSFLRHLCGEIVLRHADSVRVVSQSMKAYLEQVGVRVPIHVLPIYVNADRFRAVVSHPHTQKTILWVGRFEDEKDPRTAIRVLSEVRALGFDAKLIMLGLGSLEPLLRRDAKGLPVEFPGWQDPLNYLVEADVVLSTSKEESWGASIVEALAAGIPVVAPDVGIAREAGAIVVERLKLGTAVGDVLRTGKAGKLEIPLLSSEEWAKQWRATLT